MIKHNMCYKRWFATNNFLPWDLEILSWCSVLLVLPQEEMVALLLIDYPSADGVTRQIER